MSRSYQIKVGSQLVGVVDFLGPMVLWTGPKATNAETNEIGTPFELSTESKTAILEAIRRSDKARIIPVGEYRAIAMK
jgi:hypothetical protein